MSLRRKFKSERAPLVDDDEVRRSKEKFGHNKSKHLVEATRTSQRRVSKVSGTHFTELKKRQLSPSVNFDKIF